MWKLSHHSRAAGLALAALLTVCGLSPPALGAPPRVVASIKPVHSLAAGLMAGVARPYLLVRGAGSGHDYSLRPSDARALSGAQLVFWVGPEMETYLARPLGALSSGARVVELAAAPGVKLLPAAVGRRGDGHQAADGDHGRSDPHIWLDPGNALAMVRAMERALALADPPHVRRYRANGRRLAARLEKLDRELRGLLADLAGRPYVVFHDAYRYFERRYGLRPVGSVALRQGRPPGARRLTEIRARLKASGAACVFGGPSLSPRLMATVLEGTGARAGVLHPLGTQLAPGEGLYFELMRGLAAALVACLAPGG